ncbi:hypothetical protein YQE_03610, partial [Dendroctonus ponderosae]
MVVLENVCRLVGSALWNSTLVLIFIASMCMDPRLSAAPKISAEAASLTDECQVTPFCVHWQMRLVHSSKYPAPLKPGGSNESGEREASVSLFCPKAKPGERKFIKVTTKAPLDCMCRPCTGIEESAIIPQEIAGYTDEGPLSGHFMRSHVQ